MSNSTVEFLTAAVVLLAAHVTRAVRHSFLFPRRRLSRRFDLLLGLALGYTLNTLAPWRLGEVVRTLFIAIRLRLHVSYVAATIVAERLSDLCLVASLWVVLAVTGGGTWKDLLAASGPAAVAGLIIASAFLVDRSARVRRLNWRAASIFNDQIRLGLLEFISSTSQLICEGQLVSFRYVASTAIMWSLYTGAYGLFAISTHRQIYQVSRDLLGAPLHSMVGEILSSGVSWAALELLLFTTLPVTAILLYGLVRERKEIARSVLIARRFGLAPAEVVHSTLRDRFRNTEDYAAFLQGHFSEPGQIVSSFGLQHLDGAVVHKLLPGGSEALTALVESDGVMSIRKFAIGGAGDKLQVQARWLQRYGGELSLASVNTERKYDDRYRFDMPYIPSAQDLFDVVHTAPIGVSKKILKSVVEETSAFHTRHRLADASNEDVDLYLREKVVGNVERILPFARDFLNDTYLVNGEPYRLAEWDRLLDTAWLRRQIADRQTSIIHGDLTVENIIACPDYPLGWYIIDPNPQNVFNTPLIDWAKLLQSLNLGYENLNRATPSPIRDNVIDVVFMKSRSYEDLHLDFLSWLQHEVGPSRLKEVRFHELVNYLRLLPYKIKRNPDKARVFFGCTSILLRRYADAADA